MAGSPAQWPLLAQVLAEIESADSLEGADEQWRGLLKAEFKEREWDYNMGRWVYRHASLLDLALRFGQADLARHLLDFGLEQRRRLQPEDLQCLPAPSLAGLLLWSRQTGSGGRSLEERLVRKIQFPGQSWSKEKALRRWYPTAERQGWAPDWDAPIPLARLLVDAPTTRAALALASEGVRVGLSEEAESRLLDAALLLGDPGAAAALAGRGGRQPPMRAWEGLRILDCWNVASPDYAEAFLRAGQYGVLATELGDDLEEEPARKALRVSTEVAVRTRSLSLAQAVRGAAGAAPPRLDFGLPCSFLVDLKADGGAAHVGGREWEVRRVQLEVLETLGASGAGCTTDVASVVEEEDWVDVPVLFLAVLLGDEAAAGRLVHAGHSFLRLGLDSAELLSADELWIDDGDDDDPDDGFYVDLPAGRLETVERTLGLLFAVAARRCLAGLAAAGRCCLLGGQTGLLVRVAGFGAVWSEGDERVRQELQRLLGRDPLVNFDPWQRAAAARAAVELPPSEPSMEADGGTFNDGSAAGQHAGSAGEPQGARLGEQPARSSAEPPHAVDGAEGAANEKDDAVESEEIGQALEQSELEAAQAEQQDVQRALLLSKEEAFDDQVCVPLRLTKWSRDIVDTLLASQELLPCRQCVDAAGCELQPAWAGEALLLAPMTPELYAELGLKLTRHHVVIPVSHVGLLETALRSLPCRRRPQVRWDHRADGYDPVADSGKHEQQDEEVEKKEDAEEQGSPHEQLGQEGSEQEHGEAGNEAGEVELAAFGIAEDAHVLREMYGILVERIFIPADNFDLSVASSRAVAHSAPAEAGRQTHDVQERQREPASGPGLHNFNPRRLLASMSPRAG